MSWTNTFSWLLFTKETDTDGKVIDAMMCRLCTKHNSLGSNGSKTWSEIGYKCLRKDKVKEHQNSEQHKAALKLELNQTVGDMSTSMTNSASLAIKDALKVLYYIISHNLPLDLFASMVDLCIDVGATNLPKLRLAKSATYSSWEMVQELLDLLSSEVANSVMTDVRSSPCYSLMVDEVSDNRTIKHLAICTRYIDPDGDVKTAFMTDTELPTGTANVITNTVVDKLKEQNLDVNDMSGFVSDGAAVFLGNKSGVAKQLKDMNPSLITTHCRDHRLALACKSSFEAIPLMRKVDDTLNRLHKYYKYSCNNTASLKNVQTAFKEKPISMKQAKHHRWLSHEQAVSSLVRSYKSVVVDLESSTISSDPVGHGLLKSLKDPNILKALLLLADVLPHVTALSLTFQRRDVNLAMVKTSVDKTLRMLDARKSTDGPWLSKESQLTTELQISRSDGDFNNTVRAKFLDLMITNIRERFANANIIEDLSVIDLNSTIDEVPVLYGMTELQALAEHFQMDEDDLQCQWQDFLQIINELPHCKRSLPQLLKLLYNSNDTGLKDMYPMVHKLYSIANTLPLSTAEVERVFSQVKLIKTSHRSNMKTETLCRLLNVKLNCTQHMFSQLVDKVCEAFFNRKNRKILKLSQ